MNVIEPYERAIQLFINLAKLKPRDFTLRKPFFRLMTLFICYVTRRRISS